MFRSDPRTRSAFLPPIVFIVCALLVFLQAYRVPVNVIGPGLDRAYPHVLNLFAFSPMRFGTDLVYTYGPLGFLLHVENVRNNLAVGYAFWFALYALFSVLLTRFVAQLTLGSARWACMVLAVCVSGFIDTERVIPCVVVVLLLMAGADRSFRTRALAVCGALSSLALLMKFPIGVACAGTTIASLAWPFDWRRTAGHVVVFAASALIALLVLWTLASGSPEGIVAYVVNSLELTRGYTAVMSSARLGERASLRYFLAAIALLATMILLLPRSYRGVALLVMPFPLFVSWKSGVVRFDGHIIALVDMAMFLGLLLCVLHLGKPVEGAGTRIAPRNAWRLPDVRPIFAITLFAVACFALNKGLVKMALTDGRFPLLSRSYTEGVGGVLNRWIPGWDPLEQALDFGTYRAELDALAAKNLAESTLPKDLLDSIGTASVDVYSFELGFVAANPGLNFRPKPVFQHFNAFTETLDRINATFFASSSRPDFLLMHHPFHGRLDGVDGRHPLFDDPIAFLEIARRYETIFVEEGTRLPRVALLKHTRVLEPDGLGSPRAIGDDVVRWNETIRLPAHDTSSVLRARVELRKTIGSAIKEAVFRLEPIYLRYVLADGTDRRYRLMPPHLASGVWISPLFEDYWSLYAFLGAKPWFGPQVVAIRFETDGPKDYSESLKLVWETIDCARRPCGPADSRVFSSSVRNPETVPIPIAGPLTTRFTVPAASLSAIDVRLSTYAKVNAGTLTLHVLDTNGRILREATADAASVRDNLHELFAFEPLNGLQGKTVELRLTYEPVNAGMLAAWRTSATAADFDFRAYGH